MGEEKTPTTITTQTAPKRALKLMELYAEINQQEVAFTLEEGDLLAARSHDEITTKFPNLNREEVGKINEALILSLIQRKEQVYSGFDPNRVNIGDEITYQFLDNGQVSFEYSGVDGNHGKTILSIKPEHSQVIAAQTNAQLQDLKAEFQQIVMESQPKPNLQARGRIDPEAQAEAEAQAEREAQAEAQAEIEAQAQREAEIHAKAVRNAISALRLSSTFQKAVLANVPREEQKEFLRQYSEELIISMELAGIQTAPGNIAYVITSRLMESAFQPRIRRNGEEMIAKMYREYGNKIRAVELAMYLKPDLKRKYEAYKEELSQCRYEDEVYAWSQKLAADLESEEPGSLGAIIRDDSSLREPVEALLKEFYGEEITGDPLEFVAWKCRHKPSTIGRHQINIDITLSNANKDVANIANHPEWKRLVTSEESIDRDLLVRSLFEHDNEDSSLLPRHIAEGFILHYYMKPIIETNDLNGNGEIDDNEMSFMGADYYAGLYASRNAAVQGALNNFPQYSLVVDGDLCFYDVNGEPDLKRMSNTMLALTNFATTLSPEQRKGLSPDLFVKTFVRLSKQPDLEDHPLWQILIVDPGKPLRVIPGEALTDGAETKIEGFGVDNTYQYADRSRAAQQVYKRRMTA